MEFEHRSCSNYLTNVLLQQVLEQSDVCDVTIQVGQWNRKFHWCVLVISPFFESIRRNRFLESQTGIVRLLTATPEAIDYAIMFLYGVLPDITESNVYQILDIAEFLWLPSLKQACVIFLRQLNVTEDTFLKLLETQSLYDFEIHDCYEFARDNLKYVLSLKEATCLTPDFLMNLLSDPERSFVTDEEKFAFLMRWAEQSPQHDLHFSEVLQCLSRELKMMGLLYLTTGSQLSPR